VIWHDLGGVVRLWQEVSRWPRLGRLVVGAMLEPGRRSFRIFRQSLRVYLCSAASFYGNPRCDSTLRAGYADYCATPLAAITGTSRVLMAADLRPLVEANPPAVPTLIIHGGQDHIVPPEQARWLAARLPQAELFVVPGAGHLSFAEREDLVNCCVRRWADAHPIFPRPATTP
jgi:pimeloyl-ACP methyl ester carboxylesterase